MNQELKESRSYQLHTCSLGVKGEKPIILNSLTPNEWNEG